MSLLVGTLSHKSDRSGDNPRRIPQELRVLFDSGLKMENVVAGSASLLSLLFTVFLTPPLPHCVPHTTLPSPLLGFACWLGCNIRPGNVFHLSWSTRME